MFYIHVHYWACASDISYFERGIIKARLYVLSDCSQSIVACLVSVFVNFKVYTIVYTEKSENTHRLSAGWRFFLRLAT